MSKNPTRIGNLPWREIDGRAVILNPRRGEVHELNPAATYLWRRADGTRSLDELARELAEDFEVELPEAMADAAEFVRSLAEHGLLA